MAPLFDRPRFHSAPDCRLSTAQCNEISDAITYLQQSFQVQCQQRGAAARGRFNAVGYGFRYGNGATNPATSDFDMYTSWNCGALSGSNTNGNTYVNTTGLIQINEVMAGLIAHEEVHHMGQDNPDHTTNVAYPTQNSCVLG